MTKHSCAVPIRLAALAALASASGAAANPGEILWSVQRDGYGSPRPAVARDGALYWTFRGLYRLDPATGQEIWFRENHASPLISIGPDGTVYGTGSVNQGTPEEPRWHPTAIALTPDNQLLWEWVYDPAYWYPDAGPTVGPDGNIYIISYGGYRSPGHLFSLTSSGAFRWEFRRFANGSGVQHLTFAGGNVMKVGEYAAIQGGPIVTYGSGLVAADMASGQFAFAIPMAAKGDPIPNPSGTGYYVTPGLSNTVRSYTAPNSLNWSHEVPWSPTGLNTLGVGSDGNVYVSEGIFRVRSLSPSGAVRWQQPNALPESYYYRPDVSPDGSVIIYTTTGPGETLGYVTALRTSDGSRLWQITLPGPSNGYTPARGYGGIAFSPDSRVAYIPANSVCYCGPTGYQERSHLFAVEVQTGGPAPCYANCDGSTAAPVLNVNDFVCFQQRFAAGDSRANCDASTGTPVLNVNDFICFQTRFAQGCP